MRSPASSPPLVSIGLAVFNGEEFLAQAIESLLGQTYSNIELIISDNASTDSTAAICARYSSEDPRVRYSRNETNIGGAKNENLTVGLARGKYFRWAAHDDFAEPALIERCVEVLEADPGVSICYSRTTQIDSNSNTVNMVTRNHGSSDRAWRRFSRVINGSEFLEETYGVMRTEQLRAIELQGDYTASDRAVIAEMSLAGRFWEIPESLFTKRLHKKNEYVDWRTRVAWFRPDATGLSFPWWRLLGELLRRGSTADASIPTRAMCVLSVGVWTIRHSPKLMKDLVANAKMAMMGKAGREKLYEETRNWD